MFPGKTSDQINQVNHGLSSDDCSLTIKSAGSRSKASVKDVFLVLSPKSASALPERWRPLSSIPVSVAYMYRGVVSCECQKECFDPASIKCFFRQTDSIYYSIYFF